MVDEPVRAEQPLFLSGKGGEDHRPAIALAPQPFRLADEQGDIGGVVQRPVIEAVAIDRFAVPIAVEMRRQDDRLAGHGGVAAREHAQDIGRNEAALLEREAGLQPIGQGEARQRGARAALRDQVRGVMRAVADQFCEGIGVERDAQEAVSLRLRPGNADTVRA